MTQKPGSTFVCTTNNGCQPYYQEENSSLSLKTFPLLSFSLSLCIYLSIVSVSLAFFSVSVCLSVQAIRAPGTEQRWEERREGGRNGGDRYD